MLLPALVIAQLVGIHAADGDRAQVAAAVQGCEQALGEGRCSAAPEGAGESRWLAELRWRDAEQRHAHVRLTRSDAGQDEVMSRDVEFDADDPLEQRYRALGLIVAAYVIASGSADPERETPPDGELPLTDAPPSDPLPPPVFLATDPEEPPRGSPCPPWGVDGAVLAALATDDGVGRLGGSLRPWWRLCDRPLLMLAQLRWSRGEREELSVSALGVSAGLGVHLAASSWPVALELRGEVVGEHVSLQARDAGGERTEADAAWRLGARAGADVLVWWGGGWAVFVGGELSVLRPRLVVDVAEEPRLREGWWGVGALAGVRWQASR